MFSRVWGNWRVGGVVVELLHQKERKKLDLKMSVIMTSGKAVLMFRCHVLSYSASCSLRGRLDGQDDVEVRPRRSGRFRDRHDLGAEQADRGTHHLCTGGWSCMACAGDDH